MVRSATSAGDVVAPPAYPYVFVPFDSADWGARPLGADYASRLITATGNRLRVPLRNAGRAAAFATQLVVQGLAAGWPARQPRVVAALVAPVIPPCGEVAVVVDLPDPMPAYIPPDCARVVLLDAMGVPPSPVDVRGDRRAAQYGYPFTGIWQGEVVDAAWDPAGRLSPLPCTARVALAAPARYDATVLACAVRTWPLNTSAGVHTSFSGSAELTGRSLNVLFTVESGRPGFRVVQDWRLSMTDDDHLAGHLTMTGRWYRRVMGELESDFVLARAPLHLPI